MSDRALTRRTLLTATRSLASSDPVLGRSVERFGPPPLWAREPGFTTLIHLILEQQVSLASAQAAFDRLQRALAAITPEGFLGLDDATLREIGFSRQKAGYGRALATELLDGFDLEMLAGLDDDAVRRELTRLHGVGRWTALGTAAMEVAGLATRPSWDELARRAEAWRPYRAVAARILWHHYLRVRRLPVD